MKLALTAVLFLILSISPGAKGGPATKRAESKVIDAKKYVDTSKADCGIQEAIDAAAAAGGGVVQLPAGRFVMERYLYLRSGVTIKGRGAKTILAVGKAETTRQIASDVPKGATEIPLASAPTSLVGGMLVFLWPDSDGDRRGETLYYKVREVRAGTIVIDEPSKFPLHLKSKPHVSWGLHTYITSPAVKGQRSITVAHPKLLKVGYAIKMTGKGDTWGHHFNVVTAIEGSKVTLDRPLTIDADESLVQHGFAMITADGEKNIGVADLVIEGWPKGPRPRWVGLDFCLAGIHTLRCDDIEIRNVEIRYWHSDGISIQRGRKAIVDKCVARNCRQRGFHPGTSFTDAEFTDLESIDNGGDGFYYCWNTTNVNLRRSLLRGNGGHGVGGLGDPGDRKLTVEGNTIEGNGLGGILINGGGDDSGSVIRNNIIRDNSRRRPGAWPGIAIFPDGEKAQGYLIEGNAIASTLAEPTQLVGIEERNGKPVRAEVSTGGKKKVVDRIADRNTIRGNALSGHRTADIIIAGAATTCDDNGRAKVIREPTDSQSSD